MRSREDLSNPQRRALDIVREVAAEKQCRPYLVGGPVRDMLLGLPASDVDLTLEEDASTLARALAKRVEGRVRSFPQFLTYKVTADGLPDIDIATARKERYRTPDALPAVTPGKLKDDLTRRDFSINAIAMDLTTGSIHDPVGGQRDLKDRVVRVLHERSFADDPTRIFRAVRLAARLGFTLERDTAKWMRDALQGGAFGDVSKERLWRELFLAMDEHEAPRVLKAFAREGVLEAMFGQKLETLPDAALERVRREVERRPELDRYVLYTGALLRGAETGPVLLEGSGLSQKRARAVLQIARDVPRFEAALASVSSERQRFRLFKAASPELLAMVAADRPRESQHVARFEEFRRFKIALRGNDLEVPGGPHIARALERTREAVFTGEIPPDQARTFAREMAMKYLSQNAEGTM